VRDIARRLFSLLPQSIRWRFDRRQFRKVVKASYPLADRYLAGLRGAEIGAAAHNHFVDAINIDRPNPDPAYVEDQRRLAGHAARIDLYAFGDDLPFKDKSIDFVLSSHVIEHFFDPIRALLEWERVSKRYVFIVVPHHERTADFGRPLTTFEELLERHAVPADVRKAKEASSEATHWSVWDCETFVELCTRIGLDVVETEDPDTKVGNGFTVVIRTDPERPVVFDGSRG